MYCKNNKRNQSQRHKTKRNKVKLLNYPSMSLHCESVKIKYLSFVLKVYKVPESFTFGGRIFHNLAPITALALALESVLALKTWRLFSCLVLQALFSLTVCNFDTRQDINY